MALRSQNRRPIAVDLFAGAGGMSLGFEMAGFDVLAAVDIDPVHCATYKYNFPFSTVLCQNILEITGARIRQQSAIGDREIDVIVSGSPCQGFSIIGKRLLLDPRNALIFEFGRLILELNPKFFVMENVPGITRGDYRHLLNSLITRLQSCGYQVADYQILNAACYGIPQARKRLFLLGCRQDMTLPNYPQPLTVPASPGQARLAVLPLSPTVWEALADLPDVERYPELLTQDWTMVEYGFPSPYAQMLRGIIPIAEDYAYPRPQVPHLLTSSRRTQHSPQSIERFKLTLCGCREPVSHFDKLQPNGISITLRAGTDKQRGAFTAARPIHPFTPRCITVREAARLHSYPDWFRFHVTKWHGFRQVGNSVPPFMAKAIAQEIINRLGIRPSQPTTVYGLGDEALLQLTLSQAQQRYLHH